MPLHEWHAALCGFHADSPTYLVLSPSPVREAGRALQVTLVPGMRLLLHEVSAGVGSCGQPHGVFIYIESVPSIIAAA